MINLFPWSATHYKLQRTAIQYILMCDEIFSMFLAV